MSGSLPPPCRPVEWRQGACRPAGGRQAPAKGHRANKFFLFTYKSLPPPWRAVGVQNCKLWNWKYISVKKVFEKYKNKKDAPATFPLVAWAWAVRGWTHDLHAVRSSLLKQRTSAVRLTIEFDWSKCRFIWKCRTGEPRVIYYCLLFFLCTTLLMDTLAHKVCCFLVGIIALLCSGHVPTCNNRGLKLAIYPLYKKRIIEPSTVYAPICLHNRSSMT